MIRLIEWLLFLLLMAFHAFVLVLLTPLWACTRLWMGGTCSWHEWWTAIMRGDFWSKTP